MSNNGISSSQDSIDDSDPEFSDAVASTETYETDQGVVFYDVNNPLAWLQSRETVQLDDAA